MPQRPRYVTLQPSICKKSAEVFCENAAHYAEVQPVWAKHRCGINARTCLVQARLSLVQAMPSLGHIQSRVCLVQDTPSYGKT